MRVPGVWVLLMLAVSSMALGAFVIWGRSARGCVVGTRCGGGEGWCCGLGRSGVGVGGYVVLAMVCDVVSVRGGPLPATPGPLVCWDIGKGRCCYVCVASVTARGIRVCYWMCGVQGTPSS